MGDLAKSCDPNAVRVPSDLEILRKFVNFLENAFNSDTFNAEKVTVENCKKALELFK